MTCKAYMEIYDVKEWRKTGNKHRVAFRFEEHNRTNIEVMLMDYTSGNLGIHRVNNEMEKYCFALQKDEWGNITVYQGDLKKFQDEGLGGLKVIIFTKDHLDLIKRL